MSVLPLLPLPWLTEERPDPYRRRRICLGCGESFEYPMKAVPAVSFVSWIKAHLPCGEFYAVPMPCGEFYSPSAPFDAVPVEEAAVSVAGLPECPQCGFAGVYLHPSGVCTDCENAAIAAYCQELKDHRGPHLIGHREPRLAGPVPPLNPAGDPCTFTTKPGPLLRRGNVKQARTKKKREMMLT